VNSLCRLQTLNLIATQLNADIRPTIQYVTTSNRSSETIHVEIVQTAYEFLSERLQEEQNEVIAVIKKLLSAHCLKDFVDSGLDNVKRSIHGKEGDLPMTHVRSGTICLVYLRPKGYFTLTRVLAASTRGKSHKSSFTIVYSH